MKALVYVGMTQVTPEPITIREGAKLMQKLRKQGRINVHMQVIR